ncbi:VanZ family protein [uncultured Microbacterium sp.]|uniref:VanZ family protein n=1 Tax=uncultured Microbacterium sp. TaxID=191216 RepID=UPI0025D2CC90|nr:VanZ family protein [uncultured Microbacterium sp.]
MPTGPRRASVAGSGHPREESVARPRRRALALLTGLYAMGLSGILLWPDHIDRDAGFAYAVIYAAFPGADPLQVDFVLNVVLFVPFGAILALSVRRRPWIVILVSLIVPVLAETVQAFFLAGRTASVADVFANVVGAFVGAIGTGALRRRLTREHARGCG